MASRSCSRNQLLPNGLRMRRNSNCSKWCVKLKYHFILYTNAPFSYAKRMKSTMSLQVWVHNSQHWKRHSKRLKLCTLWLYSIIMSPNFLISFDLFWISDHTSQPNDAKCSKAHRSQITFKTQKLMKGGQQIAGPTVERWFWLTERHFLTVLVIHTYFTLSWFTACRKWILCYFTRS